MISLDDLSREELLTLMRGATAPSPASIAQVRADNLGCEAARKRAVWSQASAKAVDHAKITRLIMIAAPTYDRDVRDAFALARQLDAAAQSDWLAYRRAAAKADTALRHARRLAALEGL